MGDRTGCGPGPRRRRGAGSPGGRALGHADGLCGVQLPHRERAALRRGGGRLHRRRARDHGSRRRVAVRGRRDQGRRGERSCAHRRALPERAPGRRRPLRLRLGALPRALLRCVRQALAGGAGAAERAPRRPQPRAALLGALAAAGDVLQTRDRQHRRHGGHPVPRQQRGDRAAGGARRDAGGACGGGGVERGAGGRHRRGLRLVRRDRLRPQGLGPYEPLLRHPCLGAAQLCVRERGRLRSARRPRPQLPAGDRAAGGGGRHRPRPRAHGLVSGTARRQRHERAGAGPDARRGACGIGATMAAEWAPPPVPTAPRSSPPSRSRLFHFPQAPGARRGACGHRRHHPPSRAAAAARSPFDLSGLAAAPGARSLRG